MTATPTIGKQMQEHFQRVASHLKTLGIRLHMEIQPPATSQDVKSAESRLELSLPPSYVEFVTTVANGLTVRWRADDGPLACFEMPPLSESVDGLLSMRDLRFYSEEKAKEYRFPYVDDSELAIETNRRMHYWLPFQADGNGDNLSVNIHRAGQGQIIFDQHDWLDGGTGANGLLMADTMPEFIESWASVCFCHPKSLWWKSVITEDGVDWGSDEFDPHFRT